MQRRTFLSNMFLAGAGIYLSSTLLNACKKANDLDQTLSPSIYPGTETSPLFSQVRLLPPTDTFFIIDEFSWQRSDRASPFISQINKCQILKVVRRTTIPGDLGRKSKVEYDKISKWGSRTSKYSCIEDSSVYTMYELGNRKIQASIPSFHKPPSGVSIPKIHLVLESDISTYFNPKLSEWIMSEYKTT